MLSVAESPVLLVKVRDLCESILADPGYQSLMRQVDDFFDDDDAREHYRQATELGQALQQKQRMGVELDSAEVGEFERHREAVVADPVTRRFLDAQNALGELQSSLSAWIGKTIELGRLPDPDELESGGCCSGSCGCHH